MINLCKIATSRGLHRNQHEEVNWRLAVDSSLPPCFHSSGLGFALQSPCNHLTGSTTYHVLSCTLNAVRSLYVHETTFYDGFESHFWTTRETTSVHIKSVQIMPS